MTSSLDLRYAGIQEYMSDSSSTALTMWKSPRVFVTGCSGCLISCGFFFFFFVFKWFQSTRIPVLQWNNGMVTWTPKSRHLIAMSFSRILKVMDLHGTRGIQIQSNGILEHSSTSSLHTRLGIVGSCISLNTGSRGSCSIL
jgi:hypothetical protein